MMKAQEIHELADGDLIKQAKALREELFKLRFQGATGELENTARMGQARREYARTLTIARQRGIDIDGKTAETDG